MSEFPYDGDDYHIDDAKGINSRRNSLARNRISKAFYSNMGSEFILRRDFIAGVDGDTLTTVQTFGIPCSGIDFIDAVATAIRQASGKTPRILGLMPMYYVIEAPGAMQALVSLQLQHGDICMRENGHFSVELAGARAHVLTARQTLADRFGDGRLSTTTWWYASGSSMGCHNIVMETPPPVHDAFYPFLNEPVDTLIDQYLAHPASILFMMGPPGTGKTSLIRHLLFSRKLNASMTYDEQLLEQDGFFLNWLCSPNADVLIVEDADTMLGARESEGNTMVSRFLNVSDGLVKLSHKKMIFTTNIGDFARIDPALMRPGRCFGAIEFRSLTAPETKAAAKAAGLPEPPDREMTLAELFNGCGDGRRMPKIRTIGF